MRFNLDYCSIYVVELRMCSPGFNSRQTIFTVFFPGLFTNVLTQSKLWAEKAWFYDVF